MEYTIEKIKELGKFKNRENFNLLLSLYNFIDNIDVKREIVSSIGRHNYDDEIYDFINNNVYNCYYMDLVYQMYRTCLYKGKNNDNFKTLGDNIKDYFNNEVINKMYEYFIFKN